MFAAAVLLLLCVCVMSHWTDLVEQQREVFAGVQVSHLPRLPRPGKVNEYCVGFHTIPLSLSSYLARYGRHNSLENLHGQRIHQGN